MATEGQTRRLDRLNGQALRAALAAGTHLLERYCDAINALNVFPVPDGDTGTNMLLTMRSVDEQSLEPAFEPISTVAQKAAHGALLGARGNSGVIFSQFLTGFAQALDGVEACDAESLATALATGSQAAYSAVSNPVEGTMLTVMRELAIAAQERSASNGADVIDVWAAALEGARVALEKTPSQLPVLREAGVVDAGGQGVVVLMEGFLCVFKGERVEDLDVELCASTKSDLVEPATVSEEFLRATEAESYGYCTQFMIEGQDMDMEKLRKTLAEMGKSVVVVGDPSLVKVHVHTFEPDAILGHGASLGKTSQVKIDDIDQQHEGFLNIHREARQPPELAVVAVTWGDGFAHLFKDLGCHAVVACGRTMNPSTQELLNAARSTGAREVVVLPNNPNVILTAKQACAISKGSLNYIPTSTIPQGVAALLAYIPEVPPDKVIEAMKASISSVKTLEVTTAARDATISGTQVSRGQVIGLLEGELVTVGASPLGVLEESLFKTELPEGGVVTLYRGSEIAELEAQMAAERLKAVLPGQEVEVVYGGQPFYHYIASIE